jgi:uncharacterized protein
VATYFFDSSAIVKRYVQEQGTNWVSSITSDSKVNSIYLARITEVEIVSALARRLSSTPLGIVTNPAIIQFVYNFNSDYKIIELTPSLLEHATTLASSRRLRGYEAVQLASALALNKVLQEVGIDSLIFVSADSELNTVASIEGLKVENPYASSIKSSK